MPVSGRSSTRRWTGPLPLWSGVTPTRSFRGGERATPSKASAPPRVLPTSSFFWQRQGQLHDGRIRVHRWRLDEQCRNHGGQPTTMILIAHVARRVGTGATPAFTRMLSVVPVSDSHARQLEVEPMKSGVQGLLARGDVHSHGGTIPGLGTLGGRRHSFEGARCLGGPGGGYPTRDRSNRQPRASLSVSDRWTSLPTAQKRINLAGMLSLERARYSITVIAACPSGP